MELWLLGSPFFSTQIQQHDYSVGKNNFIRLCLLQISLILHVLLMLKDSGYISNKSDGMYKIVINMNVKWFNFNKWTTQPMEMKVWQHQFLQQILVNATANYVKAFCQRTFRHTVKPSLNGKDQPWKSFFRQLTYLVNFLQRFWTDVDKRF